MKIEELSAKENTFVYLDIQQGGTPIGRVVCSLLDTLAPITVKQFIENLQTLKSTEFHKVIKNFMVSVTLPYAITPTSENKVNFDTIFNLALNEGHFFINTFPAPHLNGQHTIFGHVIHGKSTIRTIEYTQVTSTHVPSEPVIIAACGIWEVSMGVPVYNASYSSLAGDFYEEYPDDEESFDKEKPVESLAAAEKIKASAGLLFKENNYREAMFKYRKALRYVNELIPDADSDKVNNAKFEALKRTLYLNLSLVFNNLKDYSQGINYATYLLESNATDSEKAKSFYRRGVALFELKKLDEALTDFRKSLELRGTDKAVEQKIASVEKAIKNKKDKEKKTYAKFFG